jgi:FMN phosphatase YigB (HAD superfamily)
MLHDLSAVLFDLDGTLLGNDMDQFLPHYFERLAGRMAQFLPARQFTAALMSATGVMLKNEGPLTNEEAFAAAFYPLMPASRAELEPVFLSFYTHEFPSLQTYTQKVPGAREAVQAAIGAGCAAVVSTNPLFPLVAIEHRMSWAGVADLPFALVTSYENSHACKPSLAYYQEILDTIGCDAGRVLVVGNEPLDMVAARLGCRTFLVEGSSTKESPDMPKPTYRGSLTDLTSLLS